MGVKTRKLGGKKGGKQVGKPLASSNKKIMNHLRGNGLVPL